MTDRERLIELIVEAKKTDPETGSFTDYLADYLIEHGVIVLPCKVGDIVYTTYNGSLSVYRVTEFTVYDFLWATLSNWDYSDEYKSKFVCLDFSLNKFVFLTREEAEQALKERKK